MRATWAGSSVPTATTHGAMGVSQDTPLARMYAWIRALRFADGPDEVHRMTIARRELRRFAPPG